MEFSREDAFEILQNIHNNIYVVDDSLRVIYTSVDCVRYYGLLQTEIIGKHNSEIGNVGFFPCTNAYPTVLAAKKRLISEHISFTGYPLLSINQPVYQEDGGFQMIITVNQELFNQSQNPLKNEALTREGSPPFLHNTKSMNMVYQTIDKIAPLDVSVFIDGGSGTGKSTLAQYIHQQSNRHSGPFVAVNCAAIPDSLIEAELFGYEPYAFTGADPKGKKGLIAAAHGGTLFLDEIGDMSLSSQAKLLDVIESKQYLPVGGNQLQSADVRILSATNQNINQLVEDKKFREDLLWRLKVMELHLPPLQERKEDIPYLAQFFLQELTEKYGTEKTLSNEAISALKQYPWRGNIRQLKHVMEQIFIISTGDIIDLTALPSEFRKQDLKSLDIFEYQKNKCDWEKEIIVEAKRKYQKPKLIAEKLQISVERVRLLLAKYEEYV